MSSQYPDNVQIQDGPVAVSLSNTECAFLNIVTIDSPVADPAVLRDALATARSHAEACPHGVMLLVCPQWLPDGADALLAEAGLEFSMPMWGMAADTLTPPRREPPALDFRLAEDHDTGLDLGKVNADAYGMAHEFFCVTADLPRWRGPSRLWRGQAMAPRDRDGPAALCIDGLHRRCRTAPLFVS